MSEGATRGKHKKTKQCIANINLNEALASPSYEIENVYNCTTTQPYATYTNSSHWLLQASAQGRNVIKFTRSSSLANVCDVGNIARKCTKHHARC